MARIAQFARFFATEAAVERLLAALDEAAAAAADEPGTLVYVTHVDQAEPRAVWVYELYQDEAARAAHSGSEATGRLRSVLAETLAEPPSVHRALPRRELGVPVR